LTCITIPVTEGNAMNNDHKQPDQPAHKPAPPPVPEREPQHQPGYEAEQQAKAEKAAPKPATEHKDEAPKPRSHAARARQHVKHAKVRRHKY
jgi:hypothetical protein